jgi:hypothetical protein
VTEFAKFWTSNASRLVSCVFLRVCYLGDYLTAISVHIFHLLTTSDGVLSFLYFEWTWLPDCPFIRFRNTSCKLWLLLFSFLYVFATVESFQLQNDLFYVVPLLRKLRSVFHGKTVAQRSRSAVVHGMSSIIIPAGSLTIITDIGRGFPQPIYATAGLVPHLRHNRFILTPSSSWLPNHLVLHSLDSETVNPYSCKHEII